MIKKIKEAFEKLNWWLKRDKLDKLCWALTDCLDKAGVKYQLYPDGEIFIYEGATKEIGEAILDFADAIDELI
jgi:hypothetical protein